MTETTYVCEKRQSGVYVPIKSWKRPLSSAARVGALPPPMGGSPYSTSARNSMLTTQTTNSAFASLHSAYPGDTGTNEISGGTPPHARQAITWGTPASGQVTSATNPTFNVPGSTTVAWVGFYTLVTAGTFEGSAPLRSTKAIPFVTGPAGGGGGAEPSNTVMAPEHGFATNQGVVFLATQASVMPSNITVGTTYFVIAGSTEDQFQVATTVGGSAIAFTTDGAGIVMDVTAESFGAQGTLQLTTVTLNLLSN